MFHRSILAPLGVGILYWAAAAVSLALTQGADGVATMWPASGILFAGLIALPRAQRWPCLAFAAVASMAANGATGIPLSHTLGFTVANLAESLIAVTLLGRWCPHRPSFISPGDVARFSAAAIIGGASSATIAWLVAGRPEGLFFLSWFATVTLGMLIVTPTTLIAIALADPDQRAGVCPGTARETAALLAMVLAVTVLVFAQSSYPLLFLTLVALLAATYRLGPFGAAAGVSIIALVAPLLTGMGHGPLGLMQVERAQMSFFLQFYLLVLFATALPLAALLATRDRLGRQCAASERMHRLLADSSSDVITRFSLDGVILYVSPAVTRILGLAPGEMVGRLGVSRIHADDRAAVLDSWGRLLAGEEVEACVYRQRRRDGGWAWLEAVYRTVAASIDSPAEVVASIRDITARREAELEAAHAIQGLREANRLLGMAERAASVGHWRFTVRDHSLFWSPEVFRIHGMADEEVPTLAEAIGFYHPDDRERVEALVSKGLETGCGYSFEARIIRRGGEVRHVMSRGQPEFAADGSFVHLFGIVQDVTAQVLAERELQAAKRAAEDAAAQALRLVDTDTLTGVASRRRALAALDEAIVASREDDTPLAVAIFDIDHFKAINDRFGHAAGDAVLRDVARAATEAVRSTDLVGRLGGEEFLVLLPGASATRAIAIADQLRGAVASRGDGIDAIPRVTVSVGVALLSPDASAATLLGEADRALYRAKAAGRNAARLAA